MIPSALLLVTIALGQLCLMVLAVNIAHGFAYPASWMERMQAWMDYLVLLLVGVLMAAGGVVGWWMWGRGWAEWPWPVRVYAAACLAMALVALPAATLWRGLRRLPDRVRGRSEDIDLAREHGAATLIGAGRRSWWLKLPGTDALRLRQWDWEVELPGLPPALDGLSLLHLTDLHLAPSYTRRFFEEIADRAGRQEVDLVLFTGDLVEHVEAIAWIEPIFSRLRGRLGQFAILGNHDLHYGPERITAALERAGFSVVDGSWARVEANGASLAIGGTSAPWGPAIDPRARPEADFSILLCHTPDLFYRVASWGVDLMLSGHNHGGQVRLPVVGPVLMPSRYSRRFDRGFFRRGRSLLYVSQGVGAKHPIRVGCPAEISRFVLRSPRPDPAAPSEAESRGLASVGGPDADHPGAG